MLKKQINLWWIACCLLLILAGCTPTIKGKTENSVLPDGYLTTGDKSNIAKLPWKEYFTDSSLIALIDTALQHNQELYIILQELKIANNEVMEKSGEFLPKMVVRSAGGVEKVGRFTRNGAVEEANQIEVGRSFPEPLPDYRLDVYASWEVDVWRKLRNAKKSAYTRYLASVEGRNFMVTNLIAEIANAYYELLALDNQLSILDQNIVIQENALKTVKMQKVASRETELAVKRFEAQVFSTKSLQFDVQQKLVIVENKINFLLGRYPQIIHRNPQLFNELMPNEIEEGIPTQLLENRPDIRQAELDLIATKLDLQVIRANFYPSLSFTTAIGTQAYRPGVLLHTPQSLVYLLAGDLVAPVINRRGLKAAYLSANSRQIQAVYQYERIILNAYIEVINELNNISNLEKSYNLKAQQVEALTSSIDISNTLFKSAKADYMEVLMTQHDALDSRFELIEIKRNQLIAKVNIYRALGGGWDQLEIYD